MLQSVFDHDSSHLIPLLQEEFCEVAPVLSGDSGDEGDLLVAAEAVGVLQA